MYERIPLYAIQCQNEQPQARCAPWSAFRRHERESDGLTPAQWTSAIPRIQPNHLMSDSVQLGTLTFLPRW